MHFEIIILFRLKMCFEQLETQAPHLKASLLFKLCSIPSRVNMALLLYCT